MSIQEPIVKAIFDTMLRSGPFILDLGLKIKDVIKDQLDGDEIEVPIEAIYKELEPKITSLIDSRIHGMEKRIATNLAEVEKSIRQEVQSVISAIQSKPNVTSTPSKEVIPAERSSVISFQRGRRRELSG